MKELGELVRAHRLVTLTGVGGVGKTRLAVQVAAELAAEFPDGVWLVELAPVGDPAAVPDAVAAVLGITPRPGSTVTDSVAGRLSGRRLLLVLDNCEHVLDAAADLVETILARTTTVKVIATSREGLRVGGRAPVAGPVARRRRRGRLGGGGVVRRTGPGGAARASRCGTRPTTAAVTEICRRLDGIALAIELAAARMVSMSPAGGAGPARATGSACCRDRGAGLERHQTLRHAVGWSYDLLDDDERAVLDRCSVFAGGFDLAAATHVCGDGFDEYAVLDVLDSLVRKSLVTAEQVGGHARYGLLETIRQFAEDRLAATGTIDEVRDRHARYFAEQAVAHWDMWDGPGQRVALDWVDVEFANLRAGFRWAADQGDLATAAAIAAHTAMLGCPLQRFEPVGWAEEILAAATAADVRATAPPVHRRQPLLFTGPPDAAVGYAQTAVALEADPRYDAFDPAWAGLCEAAAHVFAGRMDRAWRSAPAWPPSPGLATSSACAGCSGACRSSGGPRRPGPSPRRPSAAARAHGNPFWIAFALARLRPGVRRERSRPSPGRRARGARLRPRAPTRALGGGHRP